MELDSSNEEEILLEKVSESDSKSIDGTTSPIKTDSSL